MLAKVYSKFAQQLTQLNKPYQLWILLDCRDASQDAVYVHTPNPNADNFPLLLDSVEWGIGDLSRYFEDMLPGCHLRAGRMGGSGPYLLYSPEYGIALEKTGAKH